MKESKFIRTKIVAGYVLLIAVCVVAVGYVYREVVRVSAPDGSYALLHTKRNVVNETLYHLYQAESYGQLMIAGYRSYDTRYRRELRIVLSCIDTLRALSDAGDSLQTFRLDSIVQLIADKERRTMSLRRAIRSAGTASLLNENIERLITVSSDTLASDSTAVRSVVAADTVAIPKRKRRFFRRLADLFSPPKEDSSVVISRRERVDSLPAVSVRDTIATVLRTLQDKVTGDRLEIYDKAWNEGLRLRYSNELVNQKIYRLIRDYEQEDTSYLLERIERTEQMRRYSMRWLGAVAAVALVLMLFFVAILLRDVNRSNRYKRALEQANRDKEALLEAREKLMLAITHDIKAPLGAVMGYIDLLSRLTTGPREMHYLHNMRSSSEHLLALVKSLLDFYRLDIHKTELNEVAFNPSELFETIREGFVAQAEAKGLSLTLVTGASARREVTGDASHIRQIADNLLSNALKFTDEGRVELQVDVTDGILVFSVRDTGRGIGCGEKEHIFQEFVRLRSARGVDGFGLGLSIVDRLVKLLGGHISLESRLGMGSRFIVSIPVCENREPAGTAELEMPEFPEGMCVLVVDDDPLQLEMTAAMCRQEGISAECCQYPEYAAKIVAEQDFAVVLTDIQMPSADGFRVLSEIRAVRSSLPVVAVSARTEASEGEFVRRGFSACLQKPFTRHELIAVVCAVLDMPGPASSQRPERAASVSASAPAAVPDFSALTAFAGDDGQAACDILHSFIDHNNSSSRILREAARKGDDAALRAVAHKMAPVFGMIGAVTIVESLRRLERHDGVMTEELCGEALETADKIDRVIEIAQKELSLRRAEFAGFMNDEPL